MWTSIIFVRVPHVHICRKINVYRNLLYFHIVSNCYCPMRLRLSLASCVLNVPPRAG
eukprot:m.18007 g.18007  ORF g.18007 m.18007 type:complete len:57 (-) comp8405_c0_seq1:18-188(-)